MAKVERVILKLSGELFQQGSEHLNFGRYDAVAKQLIEARDRTKVQLAMVVGGGNVFRGRQADSEVDPNEADSMGMMATIMNGIALREALVRNGAEDTRLMTAISMPEVAEPYIRAKGRHHLAEDRMVIIAGGLGKPGFSTDSAVAQYASELQCEMILKASTVDGIYDSDPRKNPNAKKYDEITYRQALDQNLEVMDRTAFVMCERSNIPILVFNIADLHRLPEIIDGNYSIGTLVDGVQRRQTRKSD